MRDKVAFCVENQFFIMQCSTNYLHRAAGKTHKKGTYNIPVSKGGVLAGHEGDYALLILGIKRSTVTTTTTRCWRTKNRKILLYNYNQTLGSHLSGHRTICLSSSQLTKHQDSIRSTYALVNQELHVLASPAYQNRKIRIDNSHFQVED